MIPIKDAWCAHIDITSNCGKNCVYCTRYDRHRKSGQDMPIDTFICAAQSLARFPNKVGIMGGEPLLHPQFDILCRMLKYLIPKEKIVLFTSIDPAKSKYKKIIDEYIGHVELHEHNDRQETKYRHQPLTIAIKDVVPNAKLRKALINDCWVNRKWCPTTTNRGAYFCEIAAGIADFLDINGWEFYENGKWWFERSPKDYGYQLELCQYCGMCIPMPGQPMKNKIELMSKSFVEILQKAEAPMGEYKLFEGEITVADMKAALPEWKPGCYKDSQLSETFKYSTLDWSKYED